MRRGNLRNDDRLTREMQSAMSEVAISASGKRRLDLWQALSLGDGSFVSIWTIENV